MKRARGVLEDAREHAGVVECVPILVLDELRSTIVLHIGERLGRQSERALHVNTFWFG